MTSSHSVLFIEKFIFVFPCPTVQRSLSDNSLMYQMEFSQEFLLENMKKGDSNYAI